jgi:hypothetical protein
VARGVLCTLGMDHPRIAAVLLAALALAPALAHADAPRAPSSQDWYGWQILAADAVVIGGSAVLLTSQEDDDLGAGVLLGGLALSGPVIHTLNGRADRIPTSLGLRVGAPLLAAAVFSAGCEGWDCIGATAGGFIVGGLTAELVDVLRATTDVVDESAIQPVVQLSHDATVLGAAGRF